MNKTELIKKFDELQYKPICKENLETAIRIQKALFPKEEGKQDLIDSVNHTQPPHQFLQKHWVAYCGKNPIGIVGLYAYKDYPKDAWLGWYGVLEEYRKRGFGREIFEFAKNEAKHLGFENLRLYTDEEDNYTATKLYEKLGMESEYYENKEDKYYTASRVLIYSTSLTDKPCEKWNNKNLSLGGHEEWNKRSSMKLETISFDKNTSVTKTVREIYESNFPEFERTPFDDFFVGEFAKTTKTAYLLDGKVVGLTIYYKENDLIYLIWLTVDKALQGQGIGSQILQKLHKENKNCGIALNIENPNNPKCTDKDVRLRRERFYLRNGFARSGIVFDCFNEEYTPVCLGNVDLERFMKIEAAFFPDTHNIRKIN